MNFTWNFPLEYISDELTCITDFTLIFSLNSCSSGFLISVNRAETTGRICTNGKTQVNYVFGFCQSDRRALCTQNTIQACWQVVVYKTSKQPVVCFYWRLFYFQALGHFDLSVFCFRPKPNMKDSNSSLKTPATVFVGLYSLKTEKINNNLSLVIHFLSLISIVKFAFMFFVKVVIMKLFVNKRCEPNGVQLRVIILTSSLSL